MFSFTFPTRLRVARARCKLPSVILGGFLKSGFRSAACIRRQICVQMCAAAVMLYNVLRVSATASAGQQMGAVQHKHTHRLMYLLPLRRQIMKLLTTEMFFFVKILTTFCPLHFILEAYGTRGFVRVESLGQMVGDLNVVSLKTGSRPRFESWPFAVSLPLISCLSFQ